MADEPSTGTTVAAAPAAESAPASVFDEARSALRQNTDTPASPAPDADPSSTTSTTSDEPAPAAQAPEESPEPVSDEPKGSRRQKGQALREQIEREVREQVLQEQAAARARQEAEAATTRNGAAYQQLLTDAKAGQWDAIEQIIKLQEGRARLVDGEVRDYDPASLAADAQTRGRMAAIAEITGDLGKAVSALDALDDAARAHLNAAQTPADYVQRVFEAGRTARDGEVATLKAEIDSLKGKLAGSSPSPLGANGARGGTDTSHLKGMQRYAAEAMAELGYRG